MLFKNNIYPGSNVTSWKSVAIFILGTQLFLTVPTWQPLTYCEAQDDPAHAKPAAGETKKNKDKVKKQITGNRLKEIPFDLTIPPLVKGKPSAGQRTYCQLRKYGGTDVHHTIFLPPEFAKETDKRFPVIFELPGNGPFKNRLGDISTGNIEDIKMGYGISGGKGFIWVCLPFVSADGKTNQRQWWGDADATVDYCKQVVADIVKNYRGDPKRLVLCGFSRGSIACNYIGLRDKEIASLWRAMICHSHYDGVRKWSYVDSNREAAIERLKRLGSTPQFISQERSTKATQTYLEATEVKGDFEFLDLPFPNHTDEWLLKPCEARATVRKWLAEKLAGER